MMKHPTANRVRVLLIIWLATCARGLATDKAVPPTSTDRRLVVEKFAGAPDIVQPIGIAFDSHGRLLVIESHTHFRPKIYQGPKFDRIRIAEDTNGDGKADKFGVFFEGTTSTMDIASHHDGSILIATRNEILRLRDTDNDGRADHRERIAFLDTKGDYPHNGLSGLYIDFAGDIYFGMGENLGESYKLIGSDGITISGEGDGGGIFQCKGNGKNLRRIATGFWNPFGICQDIHGRMFAVDNDPDSSPPCRLLHIMEGGDYGYQFRYGRSGKHVFQSWNGQLLGTLPMVCGTGEGPCEVISYESDGLPDEYRGRLLVAAWADHQVEQYELTPNAFTVSAKQRTLIRGDENFHPVGIAVAPDGSVYVSDWGHVNYELHGKGAIWRIRSPGRGNPTRDTDARRAILSKHLPLRESAARELAKTDTGQTRLRFNMLDEDVGIRTTCIRAFVDAKSATSIDAFLTSKVDFAPEFYSQHLRPNLADHFRAEFDLGLPKFIEHDARYVALSLFDKGQDAERFEIAMTSSNSFFYAAAVNALSRNPDALEVLANQPRFEHTRSRAGLLLALRKSGDDRWKRKIPAFLKDPSEDVRLLAVKWISDLNLKEFKNELLLASAEKLRSYKLTIAVATALLRMEGNQPTDAAIAEHFVSYLKDDKRNAEDRAIAIRHIPANSPSLKVEMLEKMLKHEDQQLLQEAVWSLAERSNPDRLTPLLQVASNPKLPDELRADAIAGLSNDSARFQDELLKIARGGSAIIRNEVFRSIGGNKFSIQTAAEIQKLANSERARQFHDSKGLLTQSRPSDVTSKLVWLSKMSDVGNVKEGRRVFFHPNAGGCAKCHRIDGRGSEVGPDLSNAGQMSRGSIIRSILRPNETVAPHFQSWQVATTDGQIRTGQLVKTYLDESTYVDPSGKSFKVKAAEVEERRASSASIMPDNLIDQLTDEELRDLLAYLCSRK